MTGEVMLSEFVRPIGAISIKTTEEKIEFSCGIFGLGRWLTDPSVTDNGQTVGERNRAYLHEKLNEWLDKTFEEKNNG